MSVFLHGLRIRNFRGIGDSQEVFPFSQFTFFVGSNNVGKSTVLDFVYRYAHFVEKPNETRSGPHAPKVTDSHIGTTISDISFSIGYPINYCLDKINAHNSNPKPTHLFKKLFEFMCDENEVIWKTFNSECKYFPEAINGSEWLTKLTPLEWNEIIKSIRPNAGASNLPAWIETIMVDINRIILQPLPSVRLIPAMRRISTSDDGIIDYDGINIIRSLSRLQNPIYSDKDSGPKFDKINKFIKYVTSSDNAQIDIPHDLSTINITIDGKKKLPLHSVGTGIEEVIMIAAFCTISVGEIICLEEPELHLHPLIQRKLLTYLSEYTDNQYLISTHSPSFIDWPNASIFHVKNDRDLSSTIISRLIDRTHKHDLCDELGVRASDIIQSNCVIWVEGPSDRTYIKYWLNQVDKRIVEGIHYSVMFYGGRLLSHLTADQGNSFIDLVNINMNSVIILDSDRTKESDVINQTKQRIVEEFSKSRGFAWVTAGREIENYIDPDQIHVALSKMYGNSYDGRVSVGFYDKSYKFRIKKEVLEKKAEKFPDKRQKSNNDEIDKIELARLIAESPADLSRLDLKNRLSDLVDFIRKSNGL